MGWTTRALAFGYSHHFHFFTPASDLTAELSSANHTCFTSSFAVSLLVACISGCVDKACIAITALSPCVTPSCDGMCPHYLDIAWWVCCTCCVHMCAWGDIVFWCFLDWLFCWVCWMHSLHPLRSGIYCFSHNFSMQHLLLLLCLIPVSHISAAFPASFCCLSDVMFSSMLLALSTNLRAFFTSPCSISLQKALRYGCFFGYDWFFEPCFNTVASHSEISSSSFPCFHHSILFFRYLRCSLFFELSDVFWSSSGRNTWSMWIANDSHILLLLKSPMRWDTPGLQFVFFRLFLLGFTCSFFPSYNFLICQIQTFSGFFYIFHLAPCYRHFSLGDFLILILATMAEPFQ